MKLIISENIFQEYLKKLSSKIPKKLKRGGRNIGKALNYVCILPVRTLRNALLQVTVFCETNRRNKTKLNNKKTCCKFILQSWSNSSERPIVKSNTSYIPMEQEVKMWNKKWKCACMRWLRSILSYGGVKWEIGWHLYSPAVKANSTSRFGKSSSFIMETKFSPIHLSGSL